MSGEGKETIEQLDVRAVLTFILGAIRTNRFSDGCLLNFRGRMDNKRVKEFYGIGRKEGVSEMEDIF